MLNIAMIAPPWIPTPPVGYGGIEYVVHHLVLELERRGHRVTLFATADSTTPASQLHHSFEVGQYARIADPLYESVGIPMIHVLESLDVIRRDGGFDIIHDHTAPVGSALLAHADRATIPPSLHTLHGPLHTTSSDGRETIDDRRCYAVADPARLAFNGISKSQVREAPRRMQDTLLEPVHNGVSLDEYPCVRGDGTGPYVTLARISRCKGHATAARLSTRLGVPLQIAGLVPGCADVAEMDAAPRASAGGDHAYYLDELRPLLAPGVVDLVGSVAGATKLELLQRARALLFPIEWDEPFGLAAIESLACGTPVVAMRRGALAEIIEHGVNGFLADDEDEFLSFMRRVDEIDPAACRRTVEDRFSTARMASEYERRYEQVLNRYDLALMLSRASRTVRRPAMQAVPRLPASRA